MFYVYVLQKFDLDGNGVVDLEEFLTVCREDSDIQMSLLNVNDVRIWILKNIDVNPPLFPIFHVNVPVLF